MQMPKLSQISFLCYNASVKFYQSCFLPGYVNHSKFISFFIVELIYLRRNFSCELHHLKNHNLWKTAFFILRKFDVILSYCCMLSRYFSYDCTDIFHYFLYIFETLKEKYYFHRSSILLWLKWSTEHFSPNHKS